MYIIEMSYRALLNIRTALEQMEADLGLSKFSEAERTILYCAMSIVDENQSLTSQNLRSRIPVETLPHATYHRLLNKLISKGVLTLINTNSKREFHLVL
jgi:predicted transcriptional regulator